MAQNVELQNSARQMTSEHQQLLTHFANVGRDWPSDDGLARTEIIVGFRSRLEELRDQLAAHFEAEESHGYFTEALARAPHLIHPADHLRCEHRELLAAFDRVLNEFRPAESSQASWSATRQQFELLTQKLQSHEHAENELLLDAVDDETGTVD